MSLLATLSKLTFGDVPTTSHKGGRPRSTRPRKYNRDELKPSKRLPHTKAHSKVSGKKKSTSLAVARRPQRTHANAMTVFSGGSKMVSTCHVQRSTVYKGAALKPVATGMFSFVMDDSGSMQGGRKDDMFEGFNAALGTIKSRKAHDLVAVYPFACRAQCAMGFTLAKKVSPKIIRTKVDKADTGGGTALRNGIALALDSIDRKRQKDFCELMVITDGCENSSSISEQDLREKIRSPGVKNFHLTLVYVGDSSSGVAQLKEIANGIDHVYVLSMKQAKGSFKKAFRTYIQQAQKRIETITVTQTFTRTVHKR